MSYHVKVLVSDQLRIECIVVVSVNQMVGKTVSCGGLDTGYQCFYHHFILQGKFLFLRNICLILRAVLPLVSGIRKKLKTLDERAIAPSSQ